MPRGVNDIDVMWFELFSHTRPEAGSSCRSNGNTTLLLLFHPVHGGCAVMNFTDFVIYTGVKQDTFGSGCLTGVDVSADTDITIALNGCFTSHLIPLFLGRSFG
ncbi:hypothetical protein YPPY54_0304 [Yersinia pestis PY-54]|nr:hypothetical protein YPPY54_0304 [Yersinia pestis PY-54]